MPAKVKTVNAELQERLKKFFDEKCLVMAERGEKYSFAQLASDLGYERNSSLLSQYFSGKYEGNLARLETRIKELLKREEIASEIIEESGHKEQKFKFVMTSIASKVIKTASICQSLGQIGRVTGGYGWGKTTCIDEIKRRDESVIVIKAHKYFTAKELFSEICAKTGLEPRGTIHRMLLALKDKLQGARRLIIIDEAEHLNPNTLDEIRQLNDRYGCGVLYVGSDKFKSKLNSLRGDYGYIVNRVKVPASLRSISFADARDLIGTVIENPTENVVEEFFREAGGEGDLGCDIRFMENHVFKCVPIARKMGISFSSNEFVEIIKDVADTLREKGRAA